MKDTNVRRMEDSDEDLLVIISMKEEEEASHQAFHEFYHRHSEFVWNVLITSNTANLPEDELTIIFNQTFLNVFEYSGSFDTMGVKDTAIIIKKIRGWLARITRRELLKYLSDDRYIPADQYELYKKMIEASRATFSDTYEKKILQDALAQLSEREQDILMTYWQFYEPGQGSQAKNLPPEVLDTLCSRYNTTKANIRQIVHRSFLKVNTFISSNHSTLISTKHVKS